MHAKYVSPTLPAKHSSADLVFCYTLPKFNSSPPENKLNAPKGKGRLPTIHFQVLLLLVSGRVWIQKVFFACRSLNLPTAKGSKTGQQKIPWLPRANFREFRQKAFLENLLKIQGSEIATAILVIYGPTGVQNSADFVLKSGLWEGPSETVFLNSYQGDTLKLSLL